MFDQHSQKHQAPVVKENSPSYYAVIPAEVRYCKDLQPNAKLLYGEISALCSKEGYCWASNKYFADLYDVDERNIKRWISSLEERKFIYIQTTKKGMYWERKIYLSKEIFTKGQKCPDRGDENVPSEGAKMSPYYYIDNNTKASKLASLPAKEKEQAQEKELIKEKPKIREVPKEELDNACRYADEYKITISRDYLKKILEKYPKESVEFGLKQMAKRLLTPNNIRHPGRVLEKIIEDKLTLKGGYHDFNHT